MYSKEDLDKIVKRIEQDDEYSDLGIAEQVIVVRTLLDNIYNSIADYMIETNEDKQIEQNILKAYNLLKF
jgi:hypothetical protein